MKSHKKSLSFSEENHFIHENNVDVYSRKVYIYGVVDDDLARNTVKNIHFLSRKSQDPIDIYINSGGGDWGAGIAIYSAIRNSQCQINGYAAGECSSMASIILQACDRRMMDKDSTMLIHPGYAAAEGNVIDVISRSKWEKDILNKMYSIYHDRASLGGVKLSLVKFKNFFSMDRYLFAEDAIKYGLIDEIF